MKQGWLLYRSKTRYIYNRNLISTFPFSIVCRLKQQQQRGGGGGGGALPLKIRPCFLIVI